LYVVEFSASKGLLWENALYKAVILLSSENLKTIWTLKCHRIYIEDFYFVDWFHGSALHGDWCIAVCEVHTNFANESACLTANNVWNEVVTIHRSQVLKMPSLYM
jgi:hypothetical protein